MRDHSSLAPATPTHPVGAPPMALLMGATASEDALYASSGGPPYGGGGGGGGGGAFGGGGGGAGWPSGGGGGAPDQVAVTIGSAPDNDLVFQQPQVSGHHARIVFDGRNLVLEDLQSTNGTFVNGQRITRQPVGPGTTVGLGSFSFVLDPSHLRKLEPVRDAMRARHASGPNPAASGGAQATVPPQRSAPMHTQPPASTVTAGGGAAPPAAANDGPSPSPSAHSISIGYDADNVIVIPMPQVSGHHCRLWKDGDRYIIEDLGSSNGTYVNGERVNRAFVKVGDQIGLGSYRFPLEPSMLGHFAKAKEVQRTQIGELPPGLVKPVKIGRDDTPGVNDIVIDKAMVSNEHCELRFIGTGWRIRDLESTNGTSVNSRSNRLPKGGEAMVTPSDVLFFGSYRFPMSRLMAFLGKDESQQSNDLTIPADKNVLIVGRDETCDITVDASQVSRRHAKLTRSGDGFTIEDLGSANGVYVNGKKVKKAQIGPNDWVGLGSYQIRFDANAGTVARNYHGDIMIQADQVTFKVDKGRKTILNDISFTVFPTEFVGLMGPSGAGKTTLMMTLNGYQPPTSGSSLINGTDLYENYSAFRGSIGYVPQDDIIHRELTVWEALYYTARLRLPPDLSKKEIEDLIMKVLTDLDIQNTRDVLIGSPEKKGISGGQRKRVNLAQELITEPSLLFLDEPTSGLSSEDTINVMKLLRKLADDGRTILLTIHQPSLEAYRMMDNIVYLADGMLVYYGPTYPDSITYFNPQAQAGTPDGDLILSDPGNALKPLSEDKRNGADMATWAGKYQQSEYFKEYVTRRKQNQDAVSLSASSKQKVRRKFGLRQWATLTRRYFLIKAKDRVNTAILLSQAPIIAGIIVGVFWSETEDSFGRMQYAPFALFLLVVSAVWFGCSNSAREIVAEQAIYKRERMVNLKIPSYVMSKFAVLGLVCAVQCMILLAVTYAPLGFEGNFFVLFFMLLLCSGAGIGMGLVLSALVRTSEAAIALVPLLLIPQVILGGLIMPIEKLSSPMYVASSFMVARWGFEGALHEDDRAKQYEISERDRSKKKEEFQARARKEGKDLTKLPPEPEHPIDRFFRDHDVGFGGDVGVLFLFNILLILGVMVILRVKDPEVG